MGRNADLSTLHIYSDKYTDVDQVFPVVFSELDGREIGLESERLQQSYSAPYTMHQHLVT